MSAEEYKTPAPPTPETPKWRPIPTTLPAVIDEFTRYVAGLANDLANQFPKDLTAQRAASQLRLAVDHAPDIVVDAMGEYLVKYGKQILAGDEKFFLTNSYDDELKAGVVESKVEMSKYLLPKLKEAWATRPVASRAQYWQIITRMLDLYITYTDLHPVCTPIDLSGTTPAESDDDSSDSETD